jgi:low affinity Fe/Cu permease
VFEKDTAGQDWWYSAESADVAFSEAALLGARLNIDLCRALPGIITGLGLLVTFIAILFALLNVHYDPVRQITGIDQLINGLSGKFVSSIAALAGASLFLIAEKPAFRRFEKNRLVLVDEVDEIIPRRTAVGILVNLQREISEQTSAFRNFDTDLSLKLKNSFSESMGPLQQRMLEAVEGLNSHLRAAEAQKQESITANLTSALAELRESISVTLTEMGDRFTEALSSRATGEFDRLSEALAGAVTLINEVSAQSQASQRQLSEIISHARTATEDQLTTSRNQANELTTLLNRLLAHTTETTASSVSEISATVSAAINGMASQIGQLSDRIVQQVSAQSEATHKQLSELIRRARDATNEQLGIGKSQIEQLSSALNRLMERITGTAESSVGNISASLTAATNEMSAKVAQFTDQMNTSMITSAQKTTETANAVLQQAESWTTKTGQQLSEVLARHQALVDRIGNASSAMDTVMVQLKESAPQLTAVAMGLKSVAGEMSVAASRAAQAIMAIQTTQDALTKTANLSQAQVLAVTEAGKQIQGDMQAYEQMFTRIRAECGQILTQLDQNLRSYTQVSRNGFEGMLKAANDQMGTAVSRLGGSIEELEELLENLSDTIGKSLPRNGR